MAPPDPPWRVDIRRTAAAAQRKLPVMLTANMRVSRSALISSMRAHVDDPGIVDEPDKRAHPIGGTEDMLDIVGIGDVPADGHGFPATRMDLMADRLGGVRVGGVIDHDAIAALGCQKRCCRPDAPAAPGHHHYAIRHAVPPSCGAL